MNGRDRENPLESECAELGEPCLRTRLVDLVDGDQDGFAGASEVLGHLPVEWGHPFLDIRHQNDGVGRFQGKTHLLGRRPDHDVVGLLTPHQAKSARVDQRERTPAPLGLGRDPVAGHARLIVDDRDAASDDAVEQSGLADIGTSDDGDQTRHAPRMTWRETGRKSKGGLLSALAPVAAGWGGPGIAGCAGSFLETRRGKRPMSARFRLD